MARRTETALVLALGMSALVPDCARAQWTLTKEQMTAYTAMNPYERFADGRPKVPDALLEKVKALVIEEAWGAVRQGCNAGRGGNATGRGGAASGATANAAGGRGAAAGATPNAAGGGGCFPNQFAGDWKILNPGKRLVGRAFTVQFMPTRPDVAAAMQAEAESKGLGRLRNQTVIDMLQPGDVIVVDLFGKIDSGTFVGDKLAYYIWKTTGTGMVVDGAMFWLGKIIPTGMPAYYRGTSPDSLGNVMLTGINIPIRIGTATVMPGDVVLGDEEGLLFIPPHLVQASLDAASSTQARDEWIKQKMDTRQYKSSDLYGTPRDPALRKEMDDYIKAHQPPKQ
jgi:4-hydroxy-4-methyl-2-oxoglutarate aldolase